MRNCKFANPESSIIDMEIDHPSYGWINFSASIDDCEIAGRSLFTRAIAGEFGVIEPFTPIQKTATEIDIARKKEIKEELFALDLSGIRAMRSIVSGNGKQNDIDKLAELEIEAKELRDELNGGIAATDDLAKSESGFFKRLINRWFS